MSETCSGSRPKGSFATAVYVAEANAIDAELENYFQELTRASLSIIDLWMEPKFPRRAATLGE
jgi:hypothetical protein